MFFYTFLPDLLNMSLTASVAIVCVLLLRLLLKKAPKVISYALWSVVLFRLLCPVSIESSLSLFGLLDAPTADTSTLTSSIVYVPTDIVHTEFPVVALPVPGVSEAINDTLPQGEEQLAADPLEAPMAIATYVWMLGVLGMAIYSAVSYLQLRRRLLTASPLRDNIYLVDEITSPFVMGLLRPKIYLPSDMEEREQAYIICHEQHHIRRGDHLIKALAFLALSIHWFNPLVWIAFIYSSKDMEMSCDEAVVKKMGDDILADYTASLLSLATGKQIIAGIPLAFGEGDTKGRIRNLANWRKPAFWVVLAAVIACIALVAVLITNPASDEVPDHAEDGYFLTIGAEGVMRIEVSTPNRDGGVIHADESLFELGEQVYLEQLAGMTDLRGVSITALGADGEIIYVFSVPESASDAEMAEIVGTDPWLLAFTALSLAYPIPYEYTSEPVTWTYSPMMSAIWHGIFHFNFDMSYSHMEVSCDEGTLLNINEKKQTGEKALRYEAGESLCWTPGVGETLSDMAAEATVRFTIYDGEEILCTGTLDIIRTGTENGQSFYEARLGGTDLLTLQQEPGNMGATLTLSDRAAIIAYSDLNRNRVNEQVIVREAEPDMLYELMVVENGTEIWSTEASPAHTGWKTIMLYSEGGQSYLVDYRPSMFQGDGSYTCTVFSLEGEGNQPAVKEEWSVDFMLPVEETPEMERFAREMNLLMRNSTVLLSTEQGILVNRATEASGLPQLYPVRFDPEEIQAAIDGTADPMEITSNAAQFPDASLEFLFASGASSWGTELTFRPDGSFRGSYSDMEIGDNAPEYPNGTCYMSMFNGRFSEMQQLNDYTWSMKLTNLTVPMKIWIEDGVRYLCDMPPGVKGGETFLLYAPGMPADFMPADCRDWWPDAYKWRNGEVETLDGWALYNVNTGEGFFTSWLS